MTKPSLYATLPVGTRVFLETFFVAPSGCWAYCYATVVEDLGGEIQVSVDEKEATSRCVARSFKIGKDRIQRIIS